MATVTLNADNFKDQVSKDGIVLVDWWAPWCGPCRSFGPVFEKASEEHGDIVFAKVNTEDEQELAGQFRIQAIPTLMAFRDRILVFAQPGALPPAALKELIEKLRALDMDQVRKEVDKALAEGEDEEDDEADA